MSDAPERIWLTPEDAAAFGRKYGHQGVTMVCVGDPSVSYFHEDQVNALVAAALELEQACDAIAGARSREQYLSMIDSGQQELLERLDEARRKVRALAQTGEGKE